MKKKLGLLLASIVVMSTLCSMSFASTSPLEKYNLYDDVMGGGGTPEPERERATSDFYSNSMRPGSNDANANDESMTEEEKIAKEEEEMQKKSESIQKIIDSVNTGNLVGPRNKALRESSRHVFSDITLPDPWKKEKSFYANPSLANIRESYHKSNFAGALQECISFVNHRNFSSLSREQKTIAYYYLAMCYTKCGQQEYAIRAYEKVISLNDSPMIVKYATNGRNCILARESAGKEQKDGEGFVDICSPRVNEPELVYPRDYIDTTSLSDMDLTPIDPNTLVNRNMKKLQRNIVPVGQNSEQDANSEEKPLNLPFGKQDEDLDKFINAPYGDGLSPKFRDEYKQLQLRAIQQKMNAKEGVVMPSEPAASEQTTEGEEETDKSSDLGSMKIAYEANSYEQIQKDPEYIRQKQEFDELNKLFSSKGEGDITDLLPYATEQGDKKLSPEVIQALMMQSLMSDLTL